MTPTCARERLFLAKRLRQGGEAARIRPPAELPLVRRELVDAGQEPAELWPELGAASGWGLPGRREWNERGQVWHSAGPPWQGRTWAET